MDSKPIIAPDDNKKGETVSSGSGDTKEISGFQDESKVESGLDVTKPVARPDRAELEAKVADLNDEVQELNHRLNEVDAKIAESKLSGCDQSEELREARNAMKSLRERKDALLRQRQDIVLQQRAAKASLDGKMQQQKSLRAELKYTSPEEIDRRIGDLEKKQSTTSMSLRDEKILLKEIDQLKQSKKLVTHLAANNDSITSERKNTQSIAEQLQNKNTELDLLKKTMDAQKQILEDLNEANSERRAVLPALFKEKDSLRKERFAKIEAIKTLRADFKARDDAFRKYQREVRRLREETKKAEQEARRVELERRRREAEEEELKRIPYQEEMELCTYLVNFLQSTYPNSACSTSLVSTGGEEPSVGVLHSSNTREVFEGMLLSGKVADGDREDEYCALNKQFGKKKGRGKKRGGQKVIDKISLVPETIEIFGVLNLEPPSTMSGVAGSIESLKAKKEWFAQQPRGVVPSIREKQRADEARLQHRDERDENLPQDDNRRLDRARHEHSTPSQARTPSMSTKSRSACKPSTDDGFNAAEVADEAFPLLPGASKISKPSTHPIYKASNGNGINPGMAEAVVKSDTELETVAMQDPTAKPTADSVQKPSDESLLDDTARQDTKSASVPST